jgi:hypothetical protein
MARAVQLGKLLSSSHQLTHNYSIIFRYLENHKTNGKNYDEMAMAIRTSLNIGPG